MENVIKDIFFSVVLKAALAEITAAIPWLAWPVIGPIFGIIFAWIGGKIFDVLETSAAFTLIDFKTEAQKTAYENAANELKATLAKPPEEQNPDEIAKAKQAFKDKLSALIKLNP